MVEDDRDDAMLEERLSGRSVQIIARQHHCAIDEVEAVIDRRLGGEIDNQTRLKAIKLDVARLEGLMQPFYERATKERDVAAGTLCVKILERRALLLGLDSPARVDIVQMQAAQQQPRHEKIREAIMRLTEQAPPARRAVIERIDQLGPEKALEMLGSPQPRRLNGGSPNDGNGPLLDGDDAVDELSDSDDIKPSH
jgi:hypothetical protein